MKVAIAYPIPFGDDGLFGGGERYAFELARALAPLVPTTLVTTSRMRSSRVVGDLRVETYPWITLVRGLRINPLVVQHLRSVGDADVVHCVTYGTLMTDLSVLFARLARRRAFITDVGGGADVSLAHYIDVAGMADGLLLLSNFARRSFPRHLDRTRVIYGGVDIDHFRPAPADAPRERKVLCVSRLLPHKGIDYLIDAVPPDLPVVVMGRPYDEAYFAQLQERSTGKSITFVTNGSDEDMLHEYQTCAVVVQPSVYKTIYGTRTEVPELLGLTVLEAMACGSPVISTSVGSLPELVVDGVTGLLVPPNDPARLRDAILGLVSDRMRALEMGAAGRARVVEKFTWSMVARRCVDSYVNCH